MTTEPGRQPYIKKYQVRLLKLKRSGHVMIPEYVLFLYLGSSWFGQLLFGF